MRILLLNHGYRGGGAERCVRELHEGLLERGHDVQVWVAQAVQGLPAGVRPIARPWERRLLPMDLLAGQTDWRHRGSIAALREVTPARFDLLHIHSLQGGWVSLGALRAACGRVPSVWTHHDEWAVTDGYICQLDGKIGQATLLQEMRGVGRWLGRSPYHDNFKNRQVGRWLDRLAPRQPVMVTPSHHIARLIRQCPRFTGCQVETLYHGVSLLDEPACAMPVAAARAAWGISPRRPVVLMVAAHLQDVHKGVWLGVAALRALPEAHRPTVFLLGRHADAWRDRLAGFEVVTGHAADAATLASAYRSADVTLVPSLGESLSFVCLESLACGRPIVAFDVGGPGEIIGDQQRGLKAAPYDVTALTAHLQAMLTDAALRDRLAAAGQAWVQAQCAMQGYLDATQRVYDLAVARWSAGGPLAGNAGRP